MFLLLGPVALSQEVPVTDPTYSARIPFKTQTPNNGYPQDVDAYNWVSGEWAPHSHTDVTYNDEGDILTEVITYANGEKYRNEYEWDLEHDYAYCDKWENGEWKEYTREVWEYEPFTGMTIYYCKEEFRDGVWVKVDEWSQLLELFGTQLQKNTFSDFNQETGQLEPKYRYSYSYYDSGLWSSILTEKYQNGAFVNYIKEEYTWLNDHQFDIVYQSNWNNNLWNKNSKFVYNWSDELSYTWTLYHRTSPTTEWTPDMRCFHEFDQYFNERKYIYEQYVLGQWNVFFGFMVALFYEGLHLVEKMIQEWMGGELKGGSGEFVNTYREVYSSFYNLGKGDRPLEPLALNCFPVPSGDLLRIEVASAGPGSKTLSMTNLAGQPIRMEVVDAMSSTVTWDISRLPSGIYIILLYDKSASVITRKIIKE